MSIQKTGAEVIDYACMQLPQRFERGFQAATDKPNPGVLKHQIANAALTGDTAFLKGVNAGAPKTVTKSQMFISRVASLVIKLMK